MLCAEVPLILRRSRIYATAAIAGVIAYLILQGFLDRTLAALLGMACVAGLQSLVNGIKVNAEQLHGLSGNLAQSSSELRSATADQTGAVTSTAAAIEQMTASIASVADNAEQVKAVSAHSADYSNQGLDRMKGLNQAMTSVQSAVKGMSDSVEKFLGRPRSMQPFLEYVGIKK